MDVFEKKINMHRKHEEIFNQYAYRSNEGVFIPDNLKNDLEKNGRELLPEEIVNEFLQVRSQYYANIINNKMKEYTYMEWVICIIEKILLEYALPIFSRVLIFYPMLSGINAEWEILYEISRIDEKLWLKHRDWQSFFIRVMKEAINQKGLVIEDEYLNGISKFIKTN